MQIDSKLIRSILLWAARADFFSSVTEDDASDAVLFHKDLLVRKGLLEGLSQIDHTRQGKPPRNVVIRGLTEYGKEWAEIAQEEQLWVVNEPRLIRVLT
jgi:hypothetical protein